MANVLVVATASGRERMMQSDLRLPRTLRFLGTVQMPGSRFSYDQLIELDHVSGLLKGTVRNRFGAQEARGVAIDGTCTLLLGIGSILSGPCTGTSFAAQEDNGKGKVTGMASYASAPVGAAFPDPAPSASAPPPGPRQTGLDMAVRAGAGDGFFDYVEGEPIADDRSSPGGRGASDGQIRLPAPPGTLWSYGRQRWVVQPGGRCSRSGLLLKNHCFDAVISHMRANPEDTKITIIALDRPAPLGAWVSSADGVGFSFVEVRRKGESFSADRDLTGRTKAPIPPGCHFSPLKEGFVLASPGPRGLVEASLWRC